MEAYFFVLPWTGLLCTGDDWEPDEG